MCIRDRLKDIKTRHGMRAFIMSNPNLSSMIQKIDNGPLAKKSFAEEEAKATLHRKTRSSINPLNFNPSEALAAATPTDTSTSSRNSGLDFHAKTAYGTFGRSKFLPPATKSPYGEKLRKDAKDPVKLKEKTLVQSLDKWDNEYRPKFGGNQKPNANFLLDTTLPHVKKEAMSDDTFPKVNTHMLNSIMATEVQKLPTSDYINFNEIEPNSSARSPKSPFKSPRSGMSRRSLLGGENTARSSASNSKRFQFEPSADISQDDIVVASPLGTISRRDSMLKLQMMEIEEPDEPSHILSLIHI
eukprot:TRINITY_DN11919_c0_g1_i1.p1 TRINITY_DN11919_c0_g1~~TRINITY_DN11919_c0_g1_i1.p1  ORF type:complete len:319 (-),score=47.91 TRINITY_DN11919_c0_g1_i1:60-959(-)